MGEPRWEGNRRQRKPNEWTYLVQPRVFDPTEGLMLCIYASPLSCLLPVLLLHVLLWFCSMGPASILSLSEGLHLCHSLPSLTHPCPPVIASSWVLLHFPPWCFFFSRGWFSETVFVFFPPHTTACPVSSSLKKGQTENVGNWGSMEGKSSGSLSALMGHFTWKKPLCSGEPPVDTRHILHAHDTPVLVFWGCHNTWPQMNSFKQ